MTAEAFDFHIAKRKCWAQGHANSRPSVTLVLRAGGDTFPALNVDVSISPTEARAMAAALEAAATHAENVLETGLGESAVDAPAVTS